MSDLELHRWVKASVRFYHWEQFHHTGFLDDFTHDIWLEMKGKNLTGPWKQYVKITCMWRPLTLWRSKYQRRLKSYTELIQIDPDGEVDLEFADWSQVPDYEIPVKKIKKRVYSGGVKSRKIQVEFLNGTTETYPGVKEFAEVLGVSRRCLYPHIGRQLSTRYTKRKLSHIKRIDYEI